MSSISRSVPGAQSVAMQNLSKGNSPVIKSSSPQSPLLLSVKKESSDRVRSEEGVMPKVGTELSGRVRSEEGVMPKVGTESSDRVRSAEGVMPKVGTESSGRVRSEEGVMPKVGTESSGRVRSEEGAMPKVGTESSDRVRSAEGAMPKDGAESSDRVRSEEGAMPKVSTESSGQVRSDKTISIGALLERSEKLHLLNKRHTTLNEKRKSLEMFEISHDNQNAQIQIVDASGQTFESSNPKCIGEVIDLWKRYFVTAIDETEVQIRDLYSM